MSHHHRVPFEYNLYKMSEREAIARYEIINRLIELNPFFGYLTHLTNPTNNHLKYTNKILEAFIFEFTYGDFNSETVEPAFKQLYNDFVKDYENSYQYLVVQIQEQQRQQMRQYEEQVRLIEQNNNRFASSQPVSFPQGQMDPYFQQQQMYQQQQQGVYAQGGNYNGYPQQAYQQNNYTHPRNSRPNYRNQGQQGHQGQYQGNNYNQKEHQPRQNQHRDNREAHQYSKQHSYPKEHRRKDFHQKPEYHQQEQTQTQLMEPQIPAVIPEPEKVVEIVVEPIVEEPKVIPKPPPQPKKFSIEEIKKFIDSSSKEELEEHANPEVVAKAKEISGWATQEVQVETKEDSKYARKDNKNYKDNRRNNNDDRPGIKTGVIKRDEAKDAQKMGYVQKDSSVVIVIGAKETLGTRQIKAQIRNKAGQDFATLKEKEYEGMNQVQKDRKEIIYNLNLIVPQNLKDIEKDLIGYLFQNQDVCKVLIEEIIKKAWDQPKYASTYAKLCSNFSKRHASEFKFNEGKKEGKKDNPFKFFLIERVQHSFDEKIQKFPKFESDQDKDNFFKETKKKIISNVKFIAELILNKILKKKTMNACISQLFESFLRHYYAYSREKQIEDSVYDFHFEAIIELIENIGEKYDITDQKQKEKEKERDPLESERIYNRIEDHVEAILKVKEAPSIPILENLQTFNGDQYFHLLGFINNLLIKKAFPRLAALLQNLVERRNNNWQKHLSAADGPKKLKEIQDDIRGEEDQQTKGKSHAPTNEQKEKAEIQKLDKKVKEMFEGWEMDKHEQLRELKDILRKYSERQFYISFLRQVADEKKDNVIKRVALFPVILNERFNSKDFRFAWLDSIKYLAIGSGDYPFCGAALAKVLQAVLEKEGKLQDHFEKFEDEDEEFFMEEVVQKYHYYSKDEAALKLIKPKNKYSGLI